MSDFSSKTPNDKSSHDPHLASRNSIKPGAGSGAYMEQSHRQANRGSIARKKGHKKGSGAYMEHSHRQTSVQKQLKVGRSSDPLEKEADAVADKVMRMPAGDTNTVRRQEMTPEEEELPISRKEKSGGEAAIAPETQAKIESARGGGQALPASERNFFEPRFGRDFSDVRVHTDSKAAEASQDINARAFTIGSDVFFNAGEYKPGTGDGRYLMAHELAHTVQQSGGVQRDVIRRRPPGWKPLSNSQYQRKIETEYDKNWSETLPIISRPFLNVRTVDRTKFGNDIGFLYSWERWPSSLLRRNIPTRKVYVKSYSKKEWKSVLTSPKITPGVISGRPDEFLHMPIAAFLTLAAKKSNIYYPKGVHQGVYYGREPNPGEVNSFLEALYELGSKMPNIPAFRMNKIIPEFLRENGKRILQNMPSSAESKDMTGIADFYNRQEGGADILVGQIMGNVAANVQQLAIEYPLGLGGSGKDRANYLKYTKNIKQMKFMMISALSQFSSDSKANKTISSIAFAGTFAAALAALALTAPMTAISTSMSLVALRAIGLNLAGTVLGNVIEGLAWNDDYNTMAMKFEKSYTAILTDMGKKDKRLRKVSDQLLPELQSLFPIVGFALNK